LEEDNITDIGNENDEEYIEIERNNSLIQKI